MFMAVNLFTLLNLLTGLVEFYMPNFFFFVFIFTQVLHYIYHVEYTLKQAILVYACFMYFCMKLGNALCLSR